MKKNNFQPVSDKELDGLLGKAFLNLDFETPENDKILSAVVDHAMHKNTITALFNKRFFGLLLLFLSFFICLSSFANYMGYFEANDHKANVIPPTPPVLKPLLLSKQALIKSAEPLNNTLAEKGLTISKITTQSGGQKEVPVQKKKSHLDQIPDLAIFSARDTSLIKNISTKDSIEKPIEIPTQAFTGTSSTNTAAAGTLANSRSQKQTAQQKRIKKVELVKPSNRVRYAVRKKKLFGGKGSMKKGKGIGPFNWFKNKRVRGR